MKRLKRFATLVFGALLVLLLLAACFSVKTDDFETSRLLTDLSFDRVVITVYDEKGQVAKRIEIDGYKSDQIKLAEAIAEGVARGVAQGASP